MHCTKIQRHLLYAFFLVGCLTTDILLNKPAFAKSQCVSATPETRIFLAHTFNDRLSYISTSNTDKVILNVQIANNSVVINCPTGITLYAVVQSNSGSYNDSIFPMSEPGLGLKVLINGQTLAARQELGNSLKFNSLELQLMQRGAIRAQSRIPLNTNAGFIRIHGSDDPVNPLLTISIQTYGRATFTDVMCRLANNITQVMLRNTSISEFKNVNTRVAPQSFSININKCASTGAENLVYRVDPMNTSFGEGVSGLSPDSTAKGIGVQILNSGLTPLEFGANYSIHGSGTTRNIDLHAAYYQLEDRPIAGTVNASFMLTLLVN